MCSPLPHCVRSAKLPHTSDCSPTNNVNHDSEAPARPSDDAGRHAPPRGAAAGCDLPPRCLSTSRLGRRVEVPRRHRGAVVRQQDCLCQVRGRGRHIDVRPNWKEQPPATQPDRRRVMGSRSAYVGGAPRTLEWGWQIRTLYSDSFATCRHHSALCHTTMLIQTNEIQSRAAPSALMHAQTGKNSRHAKA